MPRKKIAEVPYIPTGGMNPDNNGLGLRADQCIDMVNMRPVSSFMGTREGLSRFGQAGATDSPILHIHPFKEPEGTETLFGFTAQGIYKYNTALNHWQAAVDTMPLLVDSFETDVSGTALTILDVGGGWDGNNSVHIPRSPSDTSYRNGSWDFSGHTHITIYTRHFLLSGAQSTTDITIKFYGGSDLTSYISGQDLIIPYAQNQVAGLYTPWIRHRVPITTPASLNAVASIEYDVTEGSGALENVVFDLFNVEVLLPNSVEFWSTTDIIDGDKGATIVAAGTNPPALDEIEDDGALRHLYWYNTTTNLFEELIQEERFSVLQENTGLNSAVSTVITGAAVNLPTFNADGNAQRIVGGSAVFYDLRDGAIGTASGILVADVDGSGNPGYLLTATPGVDLDVGVGASYILQDGSAWKISFGTVANTEAIYVNYTYERTEVYKPRYVSSFHNRLLLGNTYEAVTDYHPTRVRWSRARDIFTYFRTEFQDVADRDISPVSNMLLQGDALMVYKQASIARGVFVGGSTVFEINTVWREQGLVAFRTLVEYNYNHFFLGGDDWYVWDGASARSITIDRETGTYRVRNNIFDYLDSSQLLRCFSAVSPSQQEVYLFVPNGNDVESSPNVRYPTRAYVYNIKQDIFYRFQYEPVSAVSKFTRGQSTAWEDMIGTWEEQNFQWSSGTLKNDIAALIFSSPSNYLLQVDSRLASDGGYFDTTLGEWVSGSLIEGLCITRDFIYSQLATADRCQHVEFSAKSSETSIGYSTNLGLDESVFEQVDVVTAPNQFELQHYFPDIVAKNIRFLLRFSGASKLFWFQSYANETDLYNE